MKIEARIERNEAVEGPAPWDEEWGVCLPLDHIICRDVDGTPHTVGEFVWPWTAYTAHQNRLLLHFFYWKQNANKVTTYMADSTAEREARIEAPRRVADAAPGELALLAGLLGLGFCPKEDKRVCVALAAAVLIQVYLAACAGDAGASFGMRFLVPCAPLLGAGLAVLFSRRLASRPGWTAAVTAACVFWNALFVMQYAGLLDQLYLNEALYALSEEQQVSVDVLATMDRLPDGTTFDIEAFARANQFPRDAAPSLRQFIPDKLTVLLVFGRRVLGAGAPGLLTG